MSSTKQGRAGESTDPKTPPIAYYDSNRGRFYTLSNAGEWIAFTEGALKRRLRWEVYADVEGEELRGSMIQKHMLALQINYNVSYAGPIAGYRKGVHDICGHRVLITSGPKLIDPKKGKTPTLSKFLSELLGDHTRLLFSWLKSALETLRSGSPFRPGQMLAIAGPSGCGKSLLQDVLTELFGGRMAKPYDYLIGETNWNDDLLGAEHLMIEDEAASTDYKSRRTFGSKLKNLVANQTQILKRRFADSIAVAAFSRVSITLNEEPESLMVMPPIDESLRDKIIFLRASKANLPFEEGDLEARRLYRELLSSELPAFVAFLESYVIPNQLRDQRYGVIGYQDASLMDDLSEMAPEEELLAMIDELKVWGINPYWQGRSAKLQAELLQTDRTGRIKAILSFPTACGVFLERIKRKHPDRIKDSRAGGKTREWTITPPAVE